MGSATSNLYVSEAFAARGPRRLRNGYDDDASAFADDFVVRHRLDGRIVALAGDGFAVFADPARRLTDDDLAERLDAQDRPRFLAHAAQVAADGRTRMLALRLRRRDGEVRPFWARTASTGEEGAVISSFRETPALDAMLAELDAAREEARLERSLKDRLLANMSHELRTPLNAILGFSEILGEPALTPEDPGKRQEYARIIHASADHLLSVVNLVLDMSRLEAGKFAIAPEPVELAPLIAECCDMLRLRARNGRVEIVVAPMAAGLEIVADKSACRQIVVNLLSNAVKFTPPGGRVAIEARVAGEAVEISVTDTGIGIHSEHLPRLGDPFFQIKNGYDRGFEGAGLGLSLVRGLVGLHDGSLKLESACGIGTRVTATLPQTSAPSLRRVALAKLETAPHLTLPAILQDI